MLGSLEPNREYCVAIKVSTSGGESGFSNSLQIPRKDVANSIMCMFSSFVIIIPIHAGIHLVIIYSYE